MRPISNVFASWTDSGTTYTGIGINVDATAYSSGSRPFNVKVNGYSVFSVDTLGTLRGNAINAMFSTANSAYDYANTLAVASGDPSFAFRQANAAYYIANISFDRANSSSNIANAAFGKANTSIQNTSVTLVGSLKVTGGLSDSTSNIYPLILGTSQAPSGVTYVDFTGIPSWAKRVTLLLSGVSFNAADDYRIQLGTSSGIDTTASYIYGSGYAGQSEGATGSTTGTGFDDYFLAQPSSTVYGTIVFTNISGNNWIMNGQLIDINYPTYLKFNVGSKALSGALDRVRLTTVAGTATFDAGTVNIMYE